MDQPRTQQWQHTSELQLPAARVRAAGWSLLSQSHHAAPGLGHCPGAWVGVGCRMRAAAQVCVGERACRGLQDQSKKTLYERRLNLLYVSVECASWCFNSAILSLITLWQRVLCGWVAVGRGGGGTGGGVGLDMEEVKG